MIQETRPRGPAGSDRGALGHGFTTLVRNRGGAHLQTSAKHATRSPFPEPHDFANGLLRDDDFVVAGLTHH